MKFPKKLYVKLEEEADSEFYLEDDSVDAFAVAGEETVAAEYQLVRRITVKAPVQID